MSPTDINQRARAFSKMHLWSPLWHCAFSSQTQNATFSKKLRFIPKQAFCICFLQNRLFELGKLKQTGIGGPHIYLLLCRALAESASGNFDQQGVYYSLYTCLKIKLAQFDSYFCTSITLRTCSITLR